jgi:tRNA-uridine 2-sulfurtransferase
MKTVYVGMSGGVDSSVAAALIKQQGYRVIGVYMKNWTQPVGGIDCPWKEDLADARAAAAALSIPFKVFDFEAEYKSKVVDYLVREYASGRTPNPDVMCNQEIKFKLFLDAAVEDGADFIATGHYARVKDGRLYAGVDEGKDQSYFLYRVEPEALQKTLMPIGEYRKEQVRKMAGELGLPTADKPDSQGICFVGEVGIREFLRQYVQTTPGPIVTTDGRVVGQHQGAVFYTVGQRHGLGVGGGRPYYVVKTDISNNTVHVTDDPNDLRLMSDSFTISQAHWIVPPEGDLSVRVRYRGELAPCELSQDGSDYVVTTNSPQKAVTVGQSAVIYRGDEVVGGGIIEESFVAISKEKASLA